MSGGSTHLWHAQAPPDGRQRGHYSDDVEEMPEPLGVVPLEGRGNLPFALVQGESLVAAASWALTTAGALLFDYVLPFDRVRDSGRALVIHDPLCPMTPASFLEEAIARSERSGAVVVGVRPVTDTVKAYDGDRLGATVDRGDLMVVTSPVVLPATVVAALEDLDTDDLAVLVDELMRRFPVQYLTAPPEGRRIVEESDLAALEVTRSRDASA